MAPQGPSNLDNIVTITVRCPDKLNVPTSETYICGLTGTDTCPDQGTENCPSC